jgi:putative oxidoreductase
MGPIPASWAHRLLGVLRIVAAILFLCHGSQKLFGWPAPAHGPLVAFSLTWFAGIIEFFGGLLLLLGLMTRPVAFLLSGQMAFAYFYAHARQAFWPLVNGGELACLYCFLFLYFAAAGGGAFALDGRRKRRV